MVDAVGAAGAVDLVDIGGRRLAAEVRGEGVPTVVLESGVGAAMRSWDDVAPALAAVTRVVRYDRAGLGQSDPGPRPRSAQTSVDDLRALLTALRVPPPYVLVGHSFGALTACLFGGLHPGEVAGLVLLEASHEEGFERLRATLSEDARAELDLWLTGNKEGVDLELSCRQAREAPPLPQVPFVVVTATAKQGTRPGWTHETAENARRSWLRHQSDLAGRVPGGRHVLADRSGHNVHRDQPGLVVEAIAGVVQAARGQT